MTKQNETNSMTAQEVEMKILKMSEENAPDIWDKIEKKLDQAALEEKVQPKVTADAAGDAKKMKKEKRVNSRRKLGSFLFGGSSFRTAVAIFVICLLGMGAVGGIQGILSSSLNMGAAVPEAYTSDSYSAYGTSASATAKEATVEGAYSNEMSAAYEAGDYAEAMPAEGASMEAAAKGEGGDDISSAANQQSGRKLIRSIDINAETKEFDDLIAFVKKEISQAGGYIETSSVSGSSYGDSYSRGRYASYTLRVPADKTDSFLELLSEQCNITNIGESTRDITLNYVDTESRITALKEEQDQLMKMIEKAETMEEIIAIRAQLSDVRYELEYYESQLKSYDNLTDYDSIYLSISEVKQVTPPQPRSITQRMGDGFMRSLASAGEGIVDFMVWAVSNIPYFIILFLIIFAIVFVVKKLRRRKKNS